MTSDERDEVVGRCIGCGKEQRASQRVFFGPGAAVKCEACGAWRDDEWLREAGRFTEFVALRAKAERERLAGPPLAAPLPKGRGRPRNPTTFGDVMSSPRPVLSPSEKTWLRAAGAFASRLGSKQNGRRFQITTDPKSPHA